MQSATYNLFWIQRIEIFKGAQPVWVYLLGSQANPELRGNSAVAYKYIADYTLGEMKSFSWICLCWKLEGYSVLTAMMLWNNLSLEKWGRAILSGFLISCRDDPVVVCDKKWQCLGLCMGSFSKHALTCHGGNFGCWVFWKIWVSLPVWKWAEAIHKYPLTMELFKPPFHVVLTWAILEGKQETLDHRLQVDLNKTLWRIFF